MQTFFWKSGIPKLLVVWLLAATSTAAQTNVPIRARQARAFDPNVPQPGMYFPQAPRPGQWRKSFGLLFTSTPPELTEEVRIAVPALDINYQRGLSKNWYLSGRLQTQFVQSNLAVGPRWARSFSDRLYAGAGLDGVGWAGALAIKNVFNSQAYGFQAIPHASLGYRLTRDLQVSFRTEAIMDLYYRTTAGSLSVEYRQQHFNGVAFVFALEQPLYKQQHVSLGLRAAYTNFNWQFWSLYSTFDYYLFYPQVFFDFIL